MKKKVLILSGGISKERLISLDTGQQVANELKKNSYRVKITEPDNNLKKNIKFLSFLKPLNDALKKIRSSDNPISLYLKLISFAGIVNTLPNLLIT